MLNEGSWGWDKTSEPGTSTLAAWAGRAHPAPAPGVEASLSGMRWAGHALLGNWLGLV